jgi:hypothetical protein
LAIPEDVIVVEGFARFEKHEYAGRTTSQGGMKTEEPQHKSTSSS